MSLTKRQREILTYLTDYSAENGYAPSFEEIANRFGYSSLATVHEHLSNLERKGYIKREYNESRAIEVLPSDVYPRALQLPLAGSVAAGMPIEAIQSQEMISVPDDFVRGRGNHCDTRLQPSASNLHPRYSPSPLPLSVRSIRTRIAAMHRFALCLLLLCASATASARNHHVAHHGGVMTSAMARPAPSQAPVPVAAVTRKTYSPGARLV